MIRLIKISIAGRIIKKSPMLPKRLCNGENCLKLFLVDKLFDMPLIFAPLAGYRYYYSSCTNTKFWEFPPIWHPLGLYILPYRGFILKKSN